jgi:hypothetical protein
MFYKFCGLFLQTWTAAMLLFTCNHLCHSWLSSYKLISCYSLLQTDNVRHIFQGLKLYPMANRTETIHVFPIMQEWNPNVYCKKDTAVVSHYTLVFETWECWKHVELQRNVSLLFLQSNISSLVLRISLNQNIWSSVNVHLTRDVFNYHQVLQISFGKVNRMLTRSQKKNASSKAFCRMVNHDQHHSMRQKVNVCSCRHW